MTGTPTARTHCRRGPTCSAIRGGWPDVVFSSRENGANWAVRAGFPAPLSRDLIQSSTLAKWATGPNDPCTVTGTVYCLRNGLPQTVLRLRYDAKPTKQRRSSSPDCSPRPASASPAGSTPSASSPKTSPPGHQRQHHRHDHRGTPPRPDRRSALHRTNGFFDAD